MSEQWVQKEKKYEAWRKEQEAEQYRRQQELAAKVAGAGVRYKEELEMRNDRLEEAQRRAEELRLALEEEKRQQLEQRAIAAELKDEERWHRRVRIKEETAKRQEQLDAECKRKAAQANL